MAQAPYLYFNRITSQDGLSHNQVNCILQDRRGFMWIGTNDGLNRYDGKYFTVFTNVPGDSTTISGNIISDLLEDENNVLWIATADGGLTRYDHRLPPGQQFRQYKHKPADPNSIPGNIINSIVQDKNGFLWLGTGGRSVLRFDKASGRFEIPVKYGTKTILTLSMADNDTLYAGREGGGILKINTKDLGSVSDPRYRNLYAKLPHAAVTAIYRDSKNSLWVGSWDEVLYRYDLATRKMESFRSGETPNSFRNDEARCFAEDGNGRLWIGGKITGLQIYDRSQNLFYNYQHDAARNGTVAGNTINCIFVDRKGLVWIGTNQGISVYNPAQQPFVQTFLPVKSPVVIYDFHSDENGDLWIATSQGLFIQRNGSAQLIHKPVKFQGEQLVVSKIFRDNDGSFYIGTNYSLFKYNPITERIELLPNTEKDTVMRKIIDSRIISILKDTIDNNPVLITIPYGHYLTYYDLKAKRWVSRSDIITNMVERFNFRDNLIRKVYKSSNGNVWLAQGKYGLARWKDQEYGELKYFTNDPSSATSISNDNVFDLAEDATGNLWVSTFGGGLNKFNPGNEKFEHIAESAHLLEGIKIDKSGNVWMISKGHLHKYDPKTRSYSEFILPDIENSGGVRGLIGEDNRGNMYVAGSGYFIRFQPSAVRESRQKPAVFITDLRVFDSSFSHMLGKKNLQLRHDQNYFTFEFSAPSYFNGTIEYQYMLEGFDDDWIDAGNRNAASYSNLEGGNYVFKVRATTRKGNWSEESTNLSITIIPPFWKRWWFFVLVAMVIAAIIYGLYRYRINELLKRQAIRNKIAQDLHDSVGSTLSSISVYSQVAKIQHSKGNENELKDVLQKISTTSTDMISEMNDIVWAINPGNDSMEKIVQRMESFARPLLQVKGISFAFKYDAAVLQLNLPMEKRKNFYLIFKEAVNNVLKYSACKNLWVKVSLSHNHVTLQVRDDGNGFDSQQMKLVAGKSLSGNGLNNMKRRADEMKGICTIESAPGMGTAVNLRFPIT